MRVKIWAITRVKSLTAFPPIQVSNKKFVKNKKTVSFLIGLNFFLSTGYLKINSIKMRIDIIIAKTPPNL